MRLLLVIDHLSSGGAQGQLTMLATELAARGHQVEFFTYHHESFHAERLHAAGITIHHHPKKSKYSLNVLQQLRAVIRGGNFDVVLSFLTTPNIYAVLATGIAARPKVVISERSSANNPLVKQANWLRRLLVRRCYQSSDHCCVNSYHLRDSMKEQFSWSDDRITTIWNGVDLNRFQFADLPKDDNLRLLSVGRIAPYKNAECLVHALNILRQQGVRFRVNWLARRFPNLTPEEESHKRHMDDLLAKFDLDSQWTWLPESHRVVEILHQHHALVHPSTVEGLPNVVCEALACGRPVLISDMLDHPRLVNDGENGFLFDPADPSQLAEKIRTFAELQSDARRAMSEAARRFAERHLAKSILVDRYEQLLTELCNRS